MGQATGIITIIQESRFRLDLGDGRLLHLTLSHGCPVEPQDLPGLRGVPVSVSFDDAPGLQGLVAHDIRRRTR